uniref:biotin/lipoyl-containing protein n=1 Tax=Chloroflexus sp. TaxID=1904827 RepID=UPI002ACDFDD3
MAYEIRVPSLGESIVEATVARWLKREGEAVATGEPVVELETDKVNLEVAADQSGVLASIACPEGTTVAIGDLLGTIEAGALPKAPPAAAPVAAPTPANEVMATPVAQKVAAEHAIDLRTVPGSGPGGRVTKEDV